MDDAAKQNDGEGVTEPITMREAARKRIAARRDFFNHLFAYLVINSLVVLIWVFTGGGTSGRHGC
jgi:2TM domain